jgi:hypothetical protein
MFQNIFLSVESDCFDERNGFGQFSESLVGECFSKIPCGPPFVHPMLACGPPFVHPMLACGPPFVHPMLACGAPFVHPICLPVPCGPPFDQNFLKHIFIG